MCDFCGCGPASIRQKDWDDLNRRVYVLEESGEIALKDEDALRELVQYTAETVTRLLDEVRAFLAKKGALERRVYDLEEGQHSYRLDPHPVPEAGGPFMMLGTRDAGRTWHLIEGYTLGGHNSWRRDSTMQVAEAEAIIIIERSTHVARIVKSRYTDPAEGLACLFDKMQALREKEDRC
jgi:hypothetical protein